MLLQEQQAAEYRALIKDGALQMEWRYEQRREMQEIVPGVYLGPYAATKDLVRLQEAGITHIVSLWDPAERKILKTHHSERFQYLHLDIADALTQNLITNFPLVKRFMDQALLEQHGRVLVNCMNGISRSPAFVIAYLMEVTQLEYEEVYSFVQNKRFCMNPNPGFKHQLVEYAPIFAAIQAVKQSPPEAGQRTSQRRSAPDDDDDNDMSMYLRIVANGEGLGSFSCRAKRGASPPKRDPSTADKKAEMRTLQYRIADLKSSIRNAKLAKKYQESEAGSLDALIDKWRRASQEAAQHLVEQMADYDHENDYYSSSWTTSTVTSSGQGGGSDSGGWWQQEAQHQRERSSLFGSAGGASETFGSVSLALARDNSDDSQQASSSSVVDREPKTAATATAAVAAVSAVATEEVKSSNSGGSEDEIAYQKSQRSRAKFRAKLDMLCERMEYQDTVEDLPSVEEAIRHPEYSDGDGDDEGRHGLSRRLPKMQRLLLGLKIDPDLLGYNAVLDEFTEAATQG
ncbi:hypothetical protein DFQ26_000335 [Actinomortierella ambigua]|nr:hypothetical protein DFQ26_000335 [Actinomortierella ambigua]